MTSSGQLSLCTCSDVGRPEVEMSGKIKRALRGKVKLRMALLETGRRACVALRHRREHAEMARGQQRDRRGGDEAARLAPEYAQLSASDLLAHFRSRDTPKVFCFDTAVEGAHQHYVTGDGGLIERAEAIVNSHRWALLGYGELDFSEQIDWLCDPVSGSRWPLAYHARIMLQRNDGSDVRVLWELNRLGHLITLGRAYCITRNARFFNEFIAQTESWRAQNPPGEGPNWSCAMEVALRAMNLLAAFDLFRRAPEFSAENLQMLLALFDAHGAHIRRNLEFSYIATSNHYLSDVAGLFWLGTCLPELRAAATWREFGRAELLREMDKQVLADGADYESSTGYHRFVTELFLFSFILARSNGIGVSEHYWRKLRAMLDYIRAYLRPDGRAPLIGDTDGGQVLPLVHRAADDHAYVFAIGASLFKDSQFKAAGAPPEEVFWLLGGQGVEDYRKLQCDDTPAASEAFREAGTYIMRGGDLYLLFNASGAGLKGRGSHGHNDALSVEVSACGCSFIADPGTYAYTSDLPMRHLFRSTAYHSTVQVDDMEQNSTPEQAPFVIGEEADPRVLRWATNAERDVVIAEHSGYRRLDEPVTHRRAVLFQKRERWWFVEDTLHGEGVHSYSFRFHVAPGAEARAWRDGIVDLCDPSTGARLLIAALDLHERPDFTPQWSSVEYGQKSASIGLSWTVRAATPLVARWALVPVCAADLESERVEVIARLRERKHPVDVSID